MTKKIKTVYFCIRGNKEYKGRNSINIFRITKDNLIPYRIDQIEYIVGQTRGVEAEVLQYLKEKNLIKLTKEQKTKSYYEDLDYNTLDFRIIGQGYHLNLI
jgi:hypothetical protein